MKDKMKFKKFCSTVAMVMVLVLCLGMFPVQAQAAGNYTIRLADASGNDVIEARPGDTIVLTLRLENNPGVIGVGVQMEYPSALVLTSAPQDISPFRSAGNGYYITSQNTTDNPYLMWWNYALGDRNQKLITAQGNMAQISLNLPLGIADGDYTITLNAPADKNTTADTNGSGVILPNTNKTITPTMVGCTIRVDTSCRHSFGDWIDTPEDTRTCTEGGSQYRVCGLCGETEQQSVDPLGHSFIDDTCENCGITRSEIPGDLDGNGIVTSDDVISLLLHVSMPMLFPIHADADYTHDGVVDSEDVIRLLLHVSMPELFPL